MSTEASLTPVSYWVRRRREQDAALAETASAWTSFVEHEASAVDSSDLLEQRAS